MNELPVQYLRECFDYDPNTGQLMWRIRPEYHFKRTKSRSSVHLAANWNSRFAGRVASSPQRKGYLAVKITHLGICRTFLAHRVVYALHYGHWPDGVIDHKNGDKSDNRIENLRDASVQENNYNQGPRKDNSSGFVGVGFCNLTGKWTSRLKVNGKNHWLGRFDTSEQANLARLAEENRLGIYRHPLHKGRADAA